MTSSTAPPEPRSFAELLAFLSDTKPIASGFCREWQFARANGGANNLVYRAAGPDGTFAVKFCVRDERDRVGREYKALSLLQRRREQLAPKPVELERERYFAPVVVQTWLGGEVLLEPPASVAAWEPLLAYYAALHRVIPTYEENSVSRALHTATSVAEGKALVRRQLAHLPDEAYPPGLHELLVRFERWPGPSWPEPRLSLCRVDPNVTNFIRTEHGLRSVDWENSGWGDPAFEVADLLAHPAYGPVSAETAAQVARHYADLSANRAAPARIVTYFHIVLVYWVVRFARTLYEVPRGLDERMVARPKAWREDTARKFRTYLELASAQF